MDKVERGRERPRGVRVHVVDLRKKKFEDVIRTELPTCHRPHGLRPALPQPPGPSPRRERARAPSSCSTTASTTAFRTWCCSRVATSTAPSRRTRTTWTRTRRSRRVRSYPGDPRPGRSRHAGVRLPVAVPAHPHLRAATGERARVLRPLDDRQYLRQRTRADGDGLRSDDAVHPRGGRERGDCADPGARPARRVQRGRSRRGAAAHRHPKSAGGRAMSIPEVRDAAASVRSGSSSSGSSPIRPGAIDYLKFPITLSTEAVSSRPPTFRPLFGLEEIFHSLRR